MFNSTPKKMFKFGNKEVRDIVLNHKNMYNEEPSYMKYTLNPEILP